MRNNVRHCLELLGMSRAELARRTGLSRSHISGIVVRGDNASAEAFAKIADALGVTLNQLLLPDQSVSREEQLAALQRREWGTPDPALLGNQPGFAAFCADLKLLDSFAVTPAELEFLRNSRLEGAEVETAADMVKLLFVLRDLGLGDNAGRRIGGEDDSDDAGGDRPAVSAADDLARGPTAPLGCRHQRGPARADHRDSPRGLPESVARPEGRSASSVSARALRAYSVFPRGSDLSVLIPPKW